MHPTQPRPAQPWCAGSTATPPDMRRLVSRRGFLRAGAVLTAAGAVPAALLGPGARPARAESCEGTQGTVPPEQRSIQLFTLTAFTAADMPFTLGQLRDIGYTVVEHAGFGSSGSAAQFRSDADAVGIRSLTGHQSISAPYDAAAFQQTLQDALAVGQRAIFNPNYDAPDEAGWRVLADALNRAGAAARAAGLDGVGHHNHAQEYTSFDGTPDGRRPIDVLMEATDPELVQMEMDLCWVWAAETDPVEFLERYPGRFTHFHVKDLDGTTGQPTFPGLGVIDFDRIFEAAARTQEITGYIIEQDTAGPAALQTAQLGWDLLDAARFACPAPSAAAPPAAPVGGGVRPGVGEPAARPVPATRDAALAATGAQEGLAVGGLTALLGGLLLARQRRLSAVAEGGAAD